MAPPVGSGSALQVRVRSAITHDQELLLLQNEEVYEQIDGVMNLTTDAGNLGTLWLTNIRVVWVAAVNVGAASPAPSSVCDALIPGATPAHVQRVGAVPDGRSAFNWSDQVRGDAGGANLQVGRRLQAGLSDRT